jgi:hypothetical protein
VRAPHVVDGGRVCDRTEQRERSRSLPPPGQHRTEPHRRHCRSPSIE